MKMINAQPRTQSSATPHFNLMSKATQFYKARRHLSLDNPEVVQSATVSVDWLYQEQEAFRRRDHQMVKAKSVLSSERLSVDALLPLLNPNDASMVFAVCGNAASGRIALNLGLRLQARGAAVIILDVLLLFLLP